MQECLNSLFKSTDTLPQIIIMNIVQLHCLFKSTICSDLILINLIFQYVSTFLG